MILGRHSFPMSLWKVIEPTVPGHLQMLVACAVVYAAISRHIDDRDAEMTSELVAAWRLADEGLANYTRRFHVNVGEAVDLLAALYPEEVERHREGGFELLDEITVSRPKGVYRECS